MSAGDLLRAERDSGSENAKIINDIIVAGNIVPVEITVNLIKVAMEKNGWAAKKYLVDGFPRNEDNEAGWHRVMGDEVDVKFVLFLDCPEEVMLDRLIKRGEAAGDARRNDDNIETAKKRFKTFIESTMPIVDLYEKVGKTRRISADADPESVYTEVKKVFEDYL